MLYLTDTNLLWLSGKIISIHINLLVQPRINLVITAIILILLIDKQA